MLKLNLDTSRIAVIGPGRLGTSFAYKFGRDNIKVTLYYHDADICREINREHLNPKHLTEDLALRSGGMDRVPRLSTRVTATNDLERVVEDHDFILLSITMNRLPELLGYLQPLIEKKAGDTCLISPIKGLTSDELTKELITPSQLIHNHLFRLKNKYQVVCIGGPFFDVDIALGRPVCVTIAGKSRICRFIREELFKFNRRELNSYYNFDIVGVEACGSLKNLVANIKGVADSLDLGDSFPGTIFARSGVEIRSLAKLLGGSFQAFYSQAGVGDMYVTLSSDASKNYRYGKYFYQLYDGNTIETNKRVLARIDGTPEGPNTIKNVHRYLEKKNMYSPLFQCAYQIFNEGGSKSNMKELLIQSCQLDRREKEYIGPVSRALYRIMPNLWYRREKGILANLDM
ncbi:NAD(P)H-dependent glycerol-3-phosphate dehydrogenase [Syntrophus aciditrophicus]|nr:3-hydroxyacyl-CoA dehydrogenase NAD-binding domain-containing protein [Syntrophus aciditrophicus]OPY17318.1 MAG: Glycerol-3-phosphate dehydrogenase (NAD(P)+) [Syntrophus sp. PtaB.Bin075]